MHVNISDFSPNLKYPNYKIYFFSWVKNSFRSPRYPLSKSSQGVEMEENKDAPNMIYTKVKTVNNCLLVRISVVFPFFSFIAGLLNDGNLFSFIGSVID